MEITEYDDQGNVLARTYGQSDPRPACPYCGSSRLHAEERDAQAGPDGGPPPRASYGSWLVCGECGREWPKDESSGR